MNELPSGLYEGDVLTLTGVEGVSSESLCFLPSGVVCLSCTLDLKLNNTLRLL